MKQAKKALLAGASALTFAFSAGAAEQAPKPVDPRITDAEMQTIMHLYNTSASKSLAAFENAFNKDAPDGAPRVVFLDHDHLSTWGHLRAQPDSNSLDGIESYIRVKTRKTLDPKITEALSDALIDLESFSLPPQVMKPGMSAADIEKSICPATPHYAGDNFKSYADTIFSEALGNKALSFTISTTDLGRYRNGRSVWRCADTRYAPALSEKKGADLIATMHKTVVFSEIGGVMEMVKNGAGTGVIDDIIRLKSLWTLLSARPGMHEIPTDDISHYVSVTHHVAPALKALKVKIEEMGVDQFRALPRKSLASIAYSLTEKESLPKEQLLSLYTHYTEASKKGTKTPDEQDLLDSTLRGMTLKEYLQGDKELDMTHYLIQQFLPQKIKESAMITQKKGVSFLQALLSAKAEMVDNTREELDNDMEAKNARLLLSHLNGISPLPDRFKEGWARVFLTPQGGK